MTVFLSLFPFPHLQSIFCLLCVKTYIGFGIANSDFSLTDMDMSVCMVDMGRVSLGHYYVKQEILPPYPHAGVRLGLGLLF